MEILLATSNAELPPLAVYQNPVFRAAFTKGDILSWEDGCNVGVARNLRGAFADDSRSGVTFDRGVSKSAVAASSNVSTILEDRGEKTNARSHRPVRGL